MKWGWLLFVGLLGCPAGGSSSPAPAVTVSPDAGNTAPSDDGIDVVDIIIWTQLSGWCWY